jgi:hypothetical protein
MNTGECYKILSGPAYQVQVEVNELLNAGWYLNGPLVVVVDREGYLVCIQSLTKFSNNNGKDMD